MAEQLDLTSPYGPQTSNWKIQAICLKRGYVPGTGFVPERSSIDVELVGENGQWFTHRWTGTAADALILALNKVDLSAVSLQRRVFNRLVADGVFPGTVSGTPD